jgi:NADH-quinone oxidoreductase subunit F
MSVYRTHLLLCGGTGCHASKSGEVKEALEKELVNRKLDTEVRVIETGCNGFCAQGPVMVVQPEGIFYQKLQGEDVPYLVEEHFLKGRPVKRLFYTEPEAAETIPTLDEIPFFARQVLRVLRNKGLVDPESIEEYIAQDGYLGAAKALNEMTPEEIIKEMKISGLRGRGGAGFPTGLKWEFASKFSGDVKYVLCNADEGDPGAFMDRSVLEADPHAVVEGMIIAAKAIGAHYGYIYCRAEYPLAIKRLGIAIIRAREYGLLGKDILGSGFDLDLEIYQGAGAFVCGEETALMASIEGRRGMPRPRPPFPAQSGLWKKPSVLNNVETYANVAQIILKGGEWYASLGTENSKGTKVFALTGTVYNIGLVEVAMGTSLKEIIYEIGGGIPDGKQFKAVQLGGPSGGCLPIDYIDTPTDYEAIVKAGAIMGSGGMIVMDEDTCMVDMARFFIDFCQDESCGKCTPCREGTKRMLQILENITEGRGKIEDIKRLEELAHFVMDSALCGLGQTAPNPVLSTLRYFRHEYEDHIIDKKCKAGVCGELIKAKCNNACPAAQNVPGYLSLVAEGRFEEAVSLIYQDNPMPGTCGRVCPNPCTEVCMRAQTDEPLAIPQIKRFAADWARNNNYTVRVKKAKSKNQKVAIIGGGPGGLAAGYDLALMGYEPTVFEELPKLGGMLRWGIPSYRLPRDILDQEIDFILNVGVEAKTNTRVGREVSFEDLRKDFDAIFIAVGAPVSLPMRIPGEDLPGVKGATEFLRDFELGLNPEVGKKVAVIGGGNAAIDVARTCKRLGSDVTIVYRRERKDMPAHEHEIADAVAEGIELKVLVAPKSISKSNGRLLFQLDECELKDYDRSGRRRPVPKDGCVIGEEYDTIFSAIGQGPDLSFSGSLETKWGTINVDRYTLATNMPGVYAGGDAATGPARVIDALAAGKRAAKEIDKYLSKKMGEKPQVGETEEIAITMKVPEDVIKLPKAKMPKVSPEERIKDFSEVELGFDEETARKECERCLRCDVKLE